MLMSVSLEKCKGYYKLKGVCLYGFELSKFYLKIFLMARENECL